MQHRVGWQQNRTLITLSVGDIILIQLEENPTTGFRWDVDQISPALSLIESKYELESKAIGAGGVRVIKVEAKSVSNGVLRLKEWQRWTGNVAKVFEIEFSVTR